MFVTLLVVCGAMHASAGGLCAPTDDKTECQAMVAFGNGLGVTGWLKNTKWLSDKTICDWHGVTCIGSHVTAITLENNNLKGSLPEELGLLTKLSVLNLNGGRPTDYYGCQGTDLRNSSLPKAFYSMNSLTSVNFEYSCLGGELADNFDLLTNMVSFSIHGNYVSGAIPQSMDKMTELQQFKLGRNPFTGGFPDMSKLHKLVQFNCNFCSLTGPILDIFGSFPDLQLSYWDGNGFTGSLPPSVAKATKLTRISFNINHLSGAIPSEWEPLATSGVLTDCRIGADTNLTAYLADYPWIQKGSGNVYSCPMPAFATGGGICNHVHGCADVINPCSPTKCK